ncbi:MAG: glycosyltransferase [Bacteroidota bacterium]
MQLSIIIVNYNVKHFLEQCLLSVYKAISTLQAEVIVVDNNSVDGSCGYIQSRFPQVKLIENRSNTGFSKANNQGIKQATGKYILLLNPDTVVREDTFTRCFHFMEDHPEAGALTVKMIDGKGRFLPESKRALPTPAVAFYKIFGFSQLFPHSRRFARYHLGHLSKHQTHSIEILPGAFMFMRHSALKDVGPLDESFFMYGEDIDLSYRFLLKGYTNYYYPQTQIIHYKGESTKKGSINYVRVFYKAMIIFAQKHFPGSQVRMFAAFIHVAIYLRAGLALAYRALKWALLPVTDIAIFSHLLIRISQFWEGHRYAPGYFPDEQLPWFYAGLGSLFLGSMLISGNYSGKIKALSIIRGVFLFLLLSLSIYALLPDSWRISRMLVISASGIALGVAFLTRSISHLLPGFPAFQNRKSKRVAIVGDTSAEIERIEGILETQAEEIELIGQISFKTPDSKKTLLGNLTQLTEIVRVNNVHEIIFSAHDISAQHIMATMLQHTHLPVDFKIAPPGTMSIIGSNSADSSGELYHLETNSIGRPLNRIIKRTFDFFSSGAILLFLPVLLISVKKRKALVNNSIGVLLGCKTWVSYCKPECNEHYVLPSLKEGIFSPLTVFAPKKNKLSTTTNANLLYAKNYKVKYDLQILWRGLREYFSA